MELKRVPVPNRDKGGKEGNKTAHKDQRGVGEKEKREWEKGEGGCGKIK